MPGWLQQSQYYPEEHQSQLQACREPLKLSEPGRLQLVLLGQLVHSEDGNAILE